jgi:hypothetical protein
VSFVSQVSNALYCGSATNAKPTVERNSSCLIVLLETVGFLLFRRNDAALIVSPSHNDHGSSSRVTMASLGSIDSCYFRQTAQVAVNSLLHEDFIPLAVLVQYLNQTEVWMQQFWTIGYLYQMVIGVDQPFSVLYLSRGHYGRRYAARDLPTNPSSISTLKRLCWSFTWACVHM